MENNNYNNIKRLLDSYAMKYGVSDVNVITNLHEASINNDKRNSEKPRYVYNSEYDMEVIDMDVIARDIYKVARGVKGEPVNTADAFIVKQNNEWYFIEFKDRKIEAGNKSMRDNIIKKAYANLYMLLDILYDMRISSGKVNFDFYNPVDFVKNHVIYIVVCSSDKNPHVYEQIKNNSYLKQNYTPVFMQRLKDYLFKDAYIFTEDFFERNFVRKFSN